MGPRQFHPGMGALPRRAVAGSVPGAGTRAGLPARELGRDRGRGRRPAGRGPAGRVRGGGHPGPTKLPLMGLSRAKLDQAAGLMDKHGLDCWLVQFARETGNRPDPTDYLVGAAVTWPSAFLLNKDGRRVAIVGSGDVTQVQAGGVWDDVRGYVAGPRQTLLEVLEEWRPGA